MLSYKSCIVCGIIGGNKADLLEWALGLKGGHEAGTRGCWKFQKFLVPYLQPSLDLQKVNWHIKIKFVLFIVFSLPMIFNLFNSQKSHWILNQLKRKSNLKEWERSLRTAGGQASMSVAPSPIMTIFLKWNFSFKSLITFPFPPDSAVGCVSSKPAYSP